MVCCMEGRELTIIWLRVLLTLTMQETWIIEDHSLVFLSHLIAAQSVGNDHFKV